MTTQMQAALNVFNEAGIDATGDALEAPAPEAAAPEVQQPEEITPEVIAEEEPEQLEEGQEVAQAEEGEVPESYTVDSLAEAIGFETGDLYSMLKIPVHDGDDIPLGEFKDKYTEVTSENSSLKTQLTSMQGQLDMSKAGGQAGMSNEVAQAKAFIQQLQGKMSTPEMQEMKEIDPTRYLIESNDIKDNIQQTFSYINQLNQKQDADFKQQMVAFGQEYVKLIPSWSDESVKLKDQTEMRDYMRTKGWSDGELSQMVDPKIQIVLKELIDLRAEKNAATEAVKKVRKAPKVIANSRANPIVDKSANTQKLMTKARNTRNNRDLIAAGRAIMGGG